MYVILAFDTEDIYYPPEDRIDDIPGWLAEIMSDVGITGTFFVMGEKAKELMDRGRDDVLRAMARHDIASHQQGNRYPLLPQVVEGKSWRDGLEAVGEYEDWVKEQIHEAFGKNPVAFSRHNNYFAPQHVALAGDRLLPYMYMIAHIPGSHQPVWYAGALTFPQNSQTTFAGFDRIYSRDDPFDARLQELDEFIGERVSEGDEAAVVFGCHPVQVMARGWLEHHALVSGASRTPAEVGWHYRVKSLEEEDRAKANFRRLCLYLKHHPDLEVVGIEEAARLFSAEPAHVGRDALVLHAAESAESQQIVWHDVYSPAEMVCGIADSLVHWHQAGDLPARVERRNALGPVERPVVAQEVDVITHEEIISICRELLEHVSSSGHLPANVALDRGRVGLGQIAILSARAYGALARYDQYERLAVPSAPRYPRLAYEIDAWIREGIGDHWAMPLEFSCEVMAELARLQSWSMKPAWLRLPQGTVASDAYAARRHQI